MPFELLTNLPSWGCIGCFALGILVGALIISFAILLYAWKYKRDMDLDREDYYE